MAEDRFVGPGVKPDNWASDNFLQKAGYGRTLVENDHFVMRFVTGTYDRRFV